MCQQKRVAHTAGTASLGRSVGLPSAEQHAAIPYADCRCPRRAVAVQCCRVAHLPKRLLWAPLGALPAAGACNPRLGPARRPCITQAESLLHCQYVHQHLQFDEGWAAP